MLFINYFNFTFKQLIRVRLALFFTLFFPMLLYNFYGRNHESGTLVTFFNFAMQSAMLQSVGIYTSIHKNSSWGEFVSSLPAPTIYPALTTILAMFIIGIGGMGIIAILDICTFQTLPLVQLMLALIAAAIGSLPIGALGYLIGTIMEPMSARNSLVVVNLVFLFITFVPQKMNQLLALFCLPNSWLYFSINLVSKNHLDFESLSVLLIYFLGILGMIKKFNLPRIAY